MSVPIPFVIAFLVFIFVLLIGMLVAELIPGRRDEEPVDLTTLYDEQEPPPRGEIPTEGSP